MTLRHPLDLLARQLTRLGEGQSTDDALDELTRLRRAGHLSQAMLGRDGHDAKAIRTAWSRRRSTAIDADLAGLWATPHPFGVPFLAVPPVGPDADDTAARGWVLDLVFDGTAAQPTAHCSSDFTDTIRKARDFVTSNSERWWGTEVDLPAVVAVVGAPANTLVHGESVGLAAVVAYARLALSKLTQQPITLRSAVAFTGVISDGGLVTDSGRWRMADKLAGVAMRPAVRRVFMPEVGVDAVLHRTGVRLTQLDSVEAILCEVFGRVWVQAATAIPRPGIGLAKSAAVRCNPPGWLLVLAFAPRPLDMHDLIKASGDGDAIRSWFAGKANDPIPPPFDALDPSWVETLRTSDRDRLWLPVPRDTLRQLERDWPTLVRPACSGLVKVLAGDELETVLHRAWVADVAADDAQRDAALRQALAETNAHAWGRVARLIAKREAARPSRRQPILHGPSMTAAGYGERIIGAHRRASRIHGGLERVSRQLFEATTPSDQFLVLHGLAESLLCLLALPLMSRNPDGHTEKAARSLGKTQSGVARRPSLGNLAEAVELGIGDDLTIIPETQGADSGRARSLAKETERWLHSTGAWGQCAKVGPDVLATLLKHVEKLLDVSETDAGQELIEAAGTTGWVLVDMSDGEPDLAFYRGPYTDPDSGDLWVRWWSFGSSRVWRRPLDEHAPKPPSASTPSEQLEPWCLWISGTTLEDCGVSVDTVRLVDRGAEWPKIPALPRPVAWCAAMRRRFRVSSLAERLLPLDVALAIELRLAVFAVLALGPQPCQVHPESEPADWVRHFLRLPSNGPWGTPGLSRLTKRRLMEVLDSLDPDSGVSASHLDGTVAASIVAAFHDADARREVRECVRVLERLRHYVPGAHDGAGWTVSVDALLGGLLSNIASASSSVRWSAGPLSQPDTVELMGLKGTGSRRPGPAILWPVWAHRGRESLSFWPLLALDEGGEVLVLRDLKKVKSAMKRLRKGDVPASGTPLAKATYLRPRDSAVETLEGQWRFDPTAHRGIHMVIEARSAS